MIGVIGGRKYGAPAATPAGVPERRRVCVLVGSSRFKAEFHRQGERLEKQGVLALMMSFFQHADGVSVSDEEREILEGVDRARLALATEVLVIDCPGGKCPACERFCNCNWCQLCSALVEVGPYVGESTAKEIAHAESIGLPVRYLSERKE